MTNSLNIRNFVILAHIDHGKSTLADRFLELTGTVEKRLLKPQHLDQLELERERGITIKMTPVRMHYTLINADKTQMNADQRKSVSHPRESAYVLNLIDTPGHADFRYEVSRALAAVEGAIILVDATQGIQAQTLSNLEAAREAGLALVGAVNKIDIASPEQIEATAEELSKLLHSSREKIALVSGKTGENAEQLLAEVIKRVPPPRRSSFNGDGSLKISRALIFDSLYDEHRGIIAFVRVTDGELKRGTEVHLAATGTDFSIKETGYFIPNLKTCEVLVSGEIGYLATGIKDPDKIKIGDTIINADSRRLHKQINADSIRENQRFNERVSVNLALPGYEEPKPVVFVSFYPEDSDEYNHLRQALGYLKLNDAALHFDPDTSEVLGRGFKGGFLGRLHFEITADRLAREFNVSTVHSFPSVAYELRLKNNGWFSVTNPKDFIDDASEVLEPITDVEILTPPRYLGAILELKEIFRFSDIKITALGSKSQIAAKLPLGDLISDFDDKLKSASQGFASLNYAVSGLAPAEVVKMEVMVVGQLVPGLTRIIPKSFSSQEARRTVEKLKKLLPQQQFSQAIQAQVAGRIIARETIPALRKDVTGYLYGGDRTRKMKLWKKQQAGKKRLKAIGASAPVKIPAHIFKELLKR